VSATSKHDFDSRKWRVSDYAERYFDIERPFLDAALRASVGPSVLQLGQHLSPSLVEDFDLPLLIKALSSQQGFQSGAGFSLVAADPAFLPFEPEAFSTVVLPHVLERHKLPHQVLREAHRVLMPEGHIVLTGFSPNSFIGMQRWLRPRAVCPGKYYSIGRVIDWLQLLGFEVVNRKMFHYAPISRSKRLRKTFSFFESAGDRWLPMTGGGYMISAKKRDPGSTLVGRVKLKKSKRKLVAATAAKTHTNRSKAQD